VASTSRRRQRFKTGEGASCRWRKAGARGLLARPCRQIGCSRHRQEPTLCAPISPDLAISPALGSPVILSRVLTWLSQRLLAEWTHPAPQLYKYMLSHLIYVVEQPRRHRIIVGSPLKPAPPPLQPARRRPPCVRSELSCARRVRRIGWPLCPLLPAVLSGPQVRLQVGSCCRLVFAPGARW